MTYNINNLRRYHAQQRWVIADGLEKKLNSMFPTLYCNVQPDEKEGFYLVRASQRDPEYGLAAHYCFKSVENLYRFPDDLLVARLWLISP